jgi:hypothetical protein
VHDHFADLYDRDRGAAAGNTILAFEPIGQPVAISDFKVRPQDAEFSQPIADERQTDMVDDIPTISEGVFIDTGRNVDDFYFSLIAGATSDPHADTWQGFSSLKSEALRKWENHRRASIVDPAIIYHPSLTKPSGWFRPEADENWTRNDFSVGAPPAPAPAVVRPRIDAKVTHWKFSAPQAEAVAAVAVVPPAQIRQRATPFRRVGVAAAVAPADESVRITADLRAVPLNAVGHRELNIWAAQNVAITPLLRDRIAVNRQIAPMLPSQPAVEPNFKIGFRSIIVEVERSWLFEPFLHDRSWRLPGYGSGAFARGASEAMEGLMPAIPMAFIAIKGLEISATWSADDRSQIGTRVGFGPFSLVGSVFANDVLSCPGIQIIGWICQVMPLLPPN